MEQAAPMLHLFQTRHVATELSHPRRTLGAMQHHALLHDHAHTQHTQTHTLQVEAAIAASQSHHSMLRPRSFALVGISNTSALAKRPMGGCGTCVEIKCASLEVRCQPAVLCSTPCRVVAAPPSSRACALVLFHMRDAAALVLLMMMVHCPPPLSPIWCLPLHLVGLLLRLFCSGMQGL
jgi:hypothetical protein